ncbi:234_t:CDS:2 [Acaulospora colombiana]|uniref:234_t:CDS:1 n=1 Tax=Acaulospora colombiana TaxID=27376 RepID=A0ACA9LUS2_9GLOM|nr:234_t:CDS:2 [Acaulospora colombiana]
MSLPSVGVISKWSQKEVITFLESKKDELFLLDDDIDVIKKNRVVGFSFLRINTEDLERWGMPGGPAKAIAELIKEIKSEEREVVTKKRRVDFWVEYTATDGLVSIPPTLFTILTSENFKPAPRSEFKRKVGHVQLGQAISLPSFGQIPKNYGMNYQGDSLLVTEQMIKIWHEISIESSFSIKRILSGPIGIGKSYLALFLAAKAYAEGWPLLYISNASVLNKSVDYVIAEEIVVRFLALNKDILTVDNFKRLIFPLGPSSYFDDKEMLCVVTENIMGHLLKQSKQKTLLVVDEHGSLFESNPPTPQRQMILSPLMQLDAWNDEMKGCCVILSGTAHAKYEREYIRDDLSERLIFITPLSDNIFEKLLSMNDILKSLSPEIRNIIKEITNNVPRELLNMVKFVSDELFAVRSPITETGLVELFNKYASVQRVEYYALAQKFFHNSLNNTQRYAQRRALATMFLPRKHDDMESTCQALVYQLIDLGLVYRSKKGALQYHPLSQPATDALLEIYMSMPLPRDIASSIINGNMTSLVFEDVLFQELLRRKDVTFRATDLSGNNVTSLRIVFKHFRFLREPPSPNVDDTLLRCYRGYPLFDFILGHMFIQISISNFAVHVKNLVDIKRAFEYPSSSYNLRSFDQRNLIEKYLDGAFGGIHEAKIDPRSRKFIVTQNGQPVHDFRIVYICGSPGGPNHTNEVKEFPEILHISFEELRKNLFEDLMIE